MGSHFLRQQSDEEFSIKPGPRTLLVVLGQVPQLRNLLESLENQFDLPAQTIPLQHCLRGEFLLGERGEHHDELRVEQSLGPQGGFALAGLGTKLALSLGNSFGAFSNGAK